MELVTTKCNDYDHPEFVLSYDPKKCVKDHVQTLVDFLESDIASGARYKPGETLNFGWLWLTVYDAPGDRFALYEPDMVSFPIKWVNSVSHLVTQTFIQKTVVEDLGLLDKLDFASFIHSLLICDRLYASPNYFMSRAEPKGNDTGWFVGCFSSEHDHNDPKCLKRVSVYECTLEMCKTGKATVLQFWGLPPNTAVYHDTGKRLSVKHEGKFINYAATPYLGSMYVPHSSG